MYDCMWSAESAVLVRLPRMHPKPAEFIHTKQDNGQHGSGLSTMITCDKPEQFETIK